jgi:hypothetical protein
MAKASPSNTTRRAALSACLAAALPFSLQASAQPAGRQPVLRPTELGLELIRRLPAYAEATSARVGMMDLEHVRAPGGRWQKNPEYDAAAVEAADELVDDTHDAVIEVVEKIYERLAKAPLDHLVDWAIVVNSCIDDERDVARMNASDPDDVGDLGMDSAVALTDTLCLALLNLAGVSPTACAVEPLCAAIKQRRKAGERPEPHNHSA